MTTRHRYRVKAHSEKRQGMRSRHVRFGRGAPVRRVSVTFGRPRSTPLHAILRAHTADDDTPSTGRRRQSSVAVRRPNNNADGRREKRNKSRVRAGNTIHAHPAASTTATTTLLPKTILAWVILREFRVCTKCYIISYSVL